jgi:hypothetical protein
MNENYSRPEERRSITSQVGPVFGIGGCELRLNTVSNRQPRIFIIAGKHHTRWKPVWNRQRKGKGVLARLGHAIHVLNREDKMNDLPIPCVVSNTLTFALPVSLLKVSVFSTIQPNCEVNGRERLRLVHMDISLHCLSSNHTDVTSCHFNEDLASVEHFPILTLFNSHLYLCSKK